MRILAIDDHIETFREALAAALPDYDLRCAPDGEKGLFYARQDEALDLVLLDVKMPPTVGASEHREGLEVLRRLKELRPGLPVVMLSVYNEVDTIVEAMQEGAYYYLIKPFDPGKLRSVVAGAIDAARSAREAASLRTAIDARDELDALDGAGEPERLGSLVGRSAAMRRLFAQIRRAAAMELPVFITGPTGSGKELVAREIHALSRRKGKRLEAVNAAAIPGEMLESELFGHRKGAFTGAEKDKPGRFELAEGGTMFLDEVGDMPLPLQAKLLRVLEDHIVYPLGATDGRAVDFRLVSATHNDLRESVAAGRFREDLFYRLRVIVLRVPPLAERREDIELLAGHFIAAMEEDVRPAGIAPAALERLRVHGWPGNVRELRNVLDRASFACMGEVIGPEHIEFDAVESGGSAGAAPVVAGEGSLSAGAGGKAGLWEQVRSGALRVEDLSGFKKSYGEEGLRGVIRAALQECFGDQRQAMVMIGYAETPEDEKCYTNFRKTIQRLGLTRPARRDADE